VWLQQHGWQGALSMLNTCIHATTACVCHCGLLCPLPHAPPAGFHPQAVLRQPHKWRGLLLHSAAIDVDMTASMKWVGSTPFWKKKRELGGPCPAAEHCP